MTALVTKHLPLLAGAPDGIKKLRALILDLAIRGKLVSQDPADTPASELFAAARDALSKNQKRKSSTAAGNASVDVASLPSLPSGWLWTRLVDVALINPRNSADDTLTVSFVPMAMIGAKFDSGHEHELRPWGEVKQGFTHFAEGDIGVAKITPCFENSKACVFTALSNGIGAGTTELHVVRPVADTLVPRYVLAYLKSPWFLSIGETKMTGTAGQKRLPKDFVENHPFPLPPLAEQHRIVVKVDELMTLCDRLEADQADAEAAHAQLVQALLDSITQATDAADFRAGWQRLSEHFHTLFTTEASIDALKQTVLQLTVMGKLVPQDGSDECVSAFLERIDQARTKQQADKASRSRARLGDRDEMAEPPYEAPIGWMWRNLGSVLNITGGVTLGRKLAGRKLVSMPYLRVANVQRSYLVLDQIKQVEVPEDEVEKYKLLPNDLLITEGGDWDKVGRTAIWRNEIADCLHQNHVFRARALTDEFNPRWAELYLNSMPARNYFAGSSKQTTNLASINMTQLRACAFPVPPLPEQQRIVAKVDELMALCDQLKAGLAESRQLHGQLATALVEQAVA